MTATHPCRFCGENEMLTFSYGGFPDEHWGIDERGEVLRSETGEPTPDGDRRNTSDGVWCDICGAGAPILVWNGSPAFLTRVRANILAADAEYDDDGVWKSREVAT